MKTQKRTPQWKMLTLMRRADKAWAALRNVEVVFREAWDGCSEEDRRAAFLAMGIEPADEAVRGDASDAFRGFGC